MKRLGNLWPDIVDTQNLKRAFYKAARGKRDRPDVRLFQRDFERNIQALKNSLMEETYILGNYKRFKVFDPKERIINAAEFSERVIHHAVMNVCEPVFENRLSGSVHACRKGFGQYGALTMAQAGMRRGAYYLQLDIRKYFDSIPHENILSQLHRLFKDKAVLRFWERLILSYSASEGRGLPIGSLTSQHLANYYLAKLDNWILTLSEGVAYVRYMDDFVLWSKSKPFLKETRIQIEEKLDRYFGLSLKHSGTLQPVSKGLGFLGYRVFGKRMHLNRRSRKRYLKKGAAIMETWKNGEASDAWVDSHLQPLVAFAQKGDDISWRRSANEKIWARAIGH